MQHSSQKSFNVGDIVRLKCNHLLMIVNGISFNVKDTAWSQVHVVWHNEAGLLCTATLDQRVLVKHDNENEA